MYTSIYRKYHQRIVDLLCETQMTDTVTFLRLNDTASEDYHDLYKERKIGDKDYHRWVRKVVVDENPKANTFSRQGQLIDYQLKLVLYELGDDINDGEPDPVYSADNYYPKYKDWAIYRRQVYEITSLERILPHTAKDCEGVEQQTEMGIIIGCKRRGGEDNHLLRFV